MQNQIPETQPPNGNDWVSMLIGLLFLISIVIFTFYVGVWYNQIQGLVCIPKIISPIPISQ